MILFYTLHYKRSLSIFFNFFSICGCFLFARSPLLETFVPPEDISIGRTEIFKVPAEISTEEIKALIVKAIATCSSTNTVRLEFSAGANYRIAAKEGDTVFEIRKIKRSIPQNLVLDGNSCTFTVTSWSRFMYIKNAKNIILKDFTLTYDPKNITQGIITAVKNSNDGIYEVRIDKGHQMPDKHRFTSSDLQWIIAMEQQPDGSWGMKAGSAAVMSYKSKKYPIRLDERTVEMQFSSSMNHGKLRISKRGDPLRSKILDVGTKLAILSRTNGRGAFLATECVGLTYRNITIHHSPASAFGDRYNRNTCYVGVKVYPSEGDSFTTTADGIFATNQRDGPWIENCLLQGIGDDAVVLKNNALPSKDIVTISNLKYDFGDFLSLEKNDRLIAYNMMNRELLSKHKVTSISKNPVNKSTTVKLDIPLPKRTEKGEIWIYNLSNQCNGFVLKNNVIRDNRRWGILCAGADGSILSNNFIRSQNAAIYLVNSPNYTKNKTGGVPHNIEIIGNRFDNCWHAENLQGFGVIASRMTGTVESSRDENGNVGNGNDWNGISNLKIHRNYFLNWDTISYSPRKNNSVTLRTNKIYAIYLQDVSNVSILQNHFLSKQSSETEIHPVRISDFKKVLVENNFFHGQPKNSTIQVLMSDEVNH